MVKRVLIGLGGSPDVDAKVRYALDMVRKFGADLTGVTVADLARLIDVGPIPLGAGAAATALRQHRVELAEQSISKAIEAFQKSCSECGVRWRVVREAGDPFEELVSLMRYHDLVILGMHGLFDYGLLPDPNAFISRLVVRNVRPVLAVPREYREVRRVMVAYNGSMESAKAMKSFAQIGLWPEAEVKVVTYDRPEHESAALLRDAAEYLRLWGFGVETSSSEEKPAKALLRDAEAWGADLIVMGASGRNNILRMIVGDTAEAVIAKSPVPLLISH